MVLKSTLSQLPNDLSFSCFPYYPNEPDSSIEIETSHVLIDGTPSFKAFYKSVDCLNVKLLVLDFSRVA